MSAAALQEAAVKVGDIMTSGRSVENASYFYTEIYGTIFGAAIALISL